MRTWFESTLRRTLLRIEFENLVVKGEWFDHYTAEALLSPVNVVLHVDKFKIILTWI